MPVHAFLKGGHAVLMVQKHKKSPFLADVRQPPPGRVQAAFGHDPWPFSECIPARRPPVSNTLVTISVLFPNVLSASDNSYWH